MKKKIIPAVIAIALIIIVVGISYGSKIIDKYSYSDETADLTIDYYKLTEHDEVAIVLQNELIETRAKITDSGVCYLDFESVQDLLNDRFYADFNENLLIYTTPTDMIVSQIGASDYSVSGTMNSENYVISYLEGDVLYVALDYVKKYTNFSYELFPNPNRIQMRTQWGDVTHATIKKDTNVRVKGGVKSPILRPVTAGEMVTVIEKMETWCKVKTSDAIMGYVENKFLTDEITEVEIAVTDYVEPEYTSIKRDYPINLGWHQVMTSSANGTLDEVSMNTGTMNVISPTWFSLSDNYGSITSIASSDYVKRAHERNMEVWGLVDNFSTEMSTFEVLSYTSRRTTLINNLMNETLACGMDGINIDFEQLGYETGEHFVQFLRELSIRCRANNIVLSVDNYVPRESTEHYNRKEQGIVADYVIIMGYDEHWGSGGVAGSVASIGFVEDGIVRTLEDVPADKVINAIPFYTRVWKTKGGEVTSEALGMVAANEFVDKYDLEVAWNEEACQNYAEKMMGDTFYQVWLEDEQSIETKLTIMKKHNLAGVAAWKLGFEDKSIWNVIDAFVKQ